MVTLLEPWASYQVRSWLVFIYKRHHNAKISLKILPNTIICAMHINYFSILTKCDLITQAF